MGACRPARLPPPGVAGSQPKGAAHAAPPPSGLVRAPAQGRRASRDWIAMPIASTRPPASTLRKPSAGTIGV